MNREVFRRYTDGKSPARCGFLDQRLGKGFVPAKDANLLPSVGTFG